MNQLIFKILQNLSFRLVCLVITTITATLLFNHGYFLTGCFVAIISIGSAISIIMLFKKNMSKISFLLESIENNDNSSHFTVYGIPENEKLINEALNRINKILFDARLENIQKEKYYELILNCVNTGIIVLDHKGNVFQTNREALHLLSLDVFTHVKQLQQVSKHLETIILQLLKEKRTQISFTNKTKSINLSLRSSEIIIQDKRFHIIALSNINNELNEKEIDSWINLARILTHEIMNSITPITSISDSLLSKQTTDKETRNCLEIISDTSKGLISFVESYRQFTHIPKPEPTLFYAKKFIERMIKLANHQTNEKIISFESHTEPDDLIIYADENLISQVVINLLKNAVQAIGKQPDGLIKLHAYCTKSEEIIFEVSNNGPEIDTEIAEQIFVPFFTTKPDGNGIGLSISRQIMRLSGGSLSLKHSTKQETIFILTFN